MPLDFPDGKEVLSEGVFGAWRSQYSDRKAYQRGKELVDNCLVRLHMTGFLL